MYQNIKPTVQPVSSLFDELLQASKMESENLTINARSERPSGLEMLQTIVSDQEVAIKRLAEADMKKSVEIEHLRSSLVELRQVVMRFIGSDVNDEDRPPNMEEFNRLKFQVENLKRSASCQSLNEYVSLSDKKRKGFHVESISKLSQQVQNPVEVRRLEKQLQQMKSQKFLVHSDEYNSRISPEIKKPRTNKLGKRPWGEGEDRTLAMAVQASAPKQEWSDIARVLPGRCGKQCRERWVNHLSPTVCKDAWTEEEDEIIFSTRDVRIILFQNCKIDHI